MCGINFIYSKSLPIEASIKKLMEQTNHRGPDFSSYYIINQETAIAHNRLSVIDQTPSSNQPFVLDNRYFLSFNGEIYNYKELQKSLLKKGVKFSTNSDTEVLAQLLIHYAK